MSSDKPHASSRVVPQGDKKARSVVWRVGRVLRGAAALGLFGRDWKKEEDTATGYDVWRRHWGAGQGAVDRIEVEDPATGKRWEEFHYKDGKVYDDKGDRIWPKR